MSSATTPDAVASILPNTLSAQTAPGTIRVARVLTRLIDKDTRPNILFLCERNSCRSQMAEGWMRRLGRTHVRPYSAGIEPQSLNSFAVRVMEEAGIDISEHYAKSITSLSHIHFHFVIVVCDEAARQCPVFPKKTRVVRATFPDPLAQINGSVRPAEVMDEYRHVRDQIQDYVTRYVDLFEASQAKGTGGTGQGTEGKSLVHRA